MDRFIDAVRKYPCLWNSTAIEYRDQELKDAAWAEVMKETDLSSVKEVKQKWKKLRDSYRDALKRQSETLAREPSNNCKKNYPWKYSGRMQFLQPYMGNRKQPAAAASPAAPRLGLAGSDSSSEANEAPEAPEAPPPKRRKPEPTDPTDIFFNSMCQSTKRFPFQSQIKIKRSLFEAVMEAEESLLAEQQSFALRWGGSGRASSSSSEPGAKPC